MTDELECFKDDGSGVVTADLVPPEAALPDGLGQQDREYRESDPGDARAGPFRFPMVDTIAL